MSTHTPGPWLARQYVSGHWEVVDDESASRIAGVVGRHAGQGDDGANARLIAAAPELLKAAIAALDFFNETRVGREWIEQGGTEADELLAAIRKAEGQPAHA